MKTLALLCTAILMSLYSFGQEMDTYIPLYGSLSGDQYVYADTAYVRSSPGIKAGIHDTLFVGDNVTIISNEKTTSSVKGILAQWSKIHYWKDGKQKEGFMWAGLLTLNAMRKGDTKFIYGVERVVTNTDKDVPNLKLEDYIIGLKVVKPKQKVAYYKFKLDSRESISFTTSQVGGGKGLDNIKNIIALTFSGEACGIPTLTYRFGWTGEKLCQLPLETDIADADVYFYDENLTFPTDKNGKPNSIVIQVEEEEATDKTDKKGNPVYKTTRERKVYKWDGFKVIPG
jgi:hypothetical protein